LNAFPATSTLHWRPAEGDKAADWTNPKPEQTAAAPSSLPRVEPLNASKEVAASQATAGAVETASDSRLAATPTASSAPAARQLAQFGQTIERSGVARASGTLAGRMEQVVSAHAEEGPGLPQPYPDSPHRLEPANFIVPGMASLPKRHDGPNLLGPQLSGSALSEPQMVESPPNLEVIGQQRMTQTPAAAPASSTSGSALWGILGLTAGVLLSAFGFRRRWSAPQARN
jgi:hypothetical protein